MSTTTTPQEPIAIIGLACRVPGAENADAFWHNISGGVVSLKEHTLSELRTAGVHASTLDLPNFVPVGGYLASASMFDADFFGMSAREARITDPQHRILMELAWEGLEDAGYNPRTWRNRMGCFAGAGMTLYAGAKVDSYLSGNVLQNLELVEQVAVPQIAMANLPDYLATKLAYRFNFKGPALTVQTACSTGLAAVHLARSSLILGECDLAVAGAVAVYSPLKKGYLADEGILSREGTCRPFDKSASGTVGGSGGGIVVLRRLADALNDGDDIRAVILGSAMNNDGSNKVSYTAPGFQGQCDVIERALRISGVDPVTIGYIETHGTGTRLGDAVEIASLAETYRKWTAERGFCALGSAKGNIGHLDTAAGVIGLIKAVLTLERATIPPLAGLRNPNPELHLEDTPFFAPVTIKAWTPRSGARRAAVSSFGAGGTNVHLVLQETPARHELPSENEPEAIVVSARSQPALEEIARRLSETLRSRRQLRLSDVAFTAAVGRAHHLHRAAFLATSLEDASFHLDELAGAETIHASIHRAPEHRARGKILGQRLALIFPGQGSFSSEALIDLYTEQAEFRRKFDECADACTPLGLDLRTVLARGVPDPCCAAIIQPVIVAAQIALAELWNAWGLRPAAVIGHSLGEYAAAHVAGAIELASCMTLVAHRGALMDLHCPSDGDMVAVNLAAEIVNAVISKLDLREQVVVAAVNGSDHTVFAGERAACETVYKTLEARGIHGVQLPVSHAFHSPAMNNVLKPFREVARATDYHPPILSFYSTVTGGQLSEINTEYWVHQIRSPVLFSNAITAASVDGYDVFLDVGLGRAIEQMTRNIVPKATIVASIGRYSANRGLKEALCHLYAAGAELTWDAVYAGRPVRRVRLPTYPFERKHYWLEPSSSAVPERVVSPAERSATWSPAWSSRPRVPFASQYAGDVLLISCGARGSLNLRDSFARRAISVDILQLCGEPEEAALILRRAVRSWRTLPGKIVLCFGPSQGKPDACELLQEVIDHIWLVTCLFQEVLDRDPGGCSITVVTNPLPAEVREFEDVSAAA